MDYFIHNQVEDSSLLYWSLYPYRLFSSIWLQLYGTASNEIMIISTESGQLNSSITEVSEHSKAVRCEKHWYSSLLWLKFSSHTNLQPLEMIWQ